MKKKTLKKQSFLSSPFISGLGLSTLAFVIMGLILSLTGYITLGKISPEETYANSLSPRKNTPTSIYTRPTPDPKAADQTAPTISFKSPLNGSNVDTSWKSGAYYVQPITLSASDNDRIMVVYVFINDILEGINVYNSTTYQQNVRIPVQAGTYTIKALAYDYNNNEGKASISITVPGRK